MPRKRKQPKSWSERLNPAEAVEPEESPLPSLEDRARQAAQKLSDRVTSERFADNPNPTRIMGLSEVLKPTSDQITIKCLRRELYLAKAKILELELRAEGVKV